MKVNDFRELEIYKINEYHCHSELIQYLKNKYGEVDVIENEDEELVQIARSDWYRNIRAQISPGDNMRIYRKLHGLSQEKLGKKPGSFTRQNNLTKKTD